MVLLRISGIIGLVLNGEKEGEVIKEKYKKASFSLFFLEQSLLHPVSDNIADS